MSGQRIRFNAGLGKKAAIAKILPVQLAKSWVPSGGVALSALWAMNAMGIDGRIAGTFCGGCWVTYAATDWILTGEKPWRYWGKFKTPKRRARAGLKFQPTAQTLKPKLKAQKIGSKTILPVENMVPIASYLSYRMNAREWIGATLLQQDKSFKIWFHFRCRGFSSTISPERGFDIAEQLQEGLKSLPDGEALTFRFSTQSDCSTRLAQLDSLINSDIQDELKFLLTSEQQRLKGLTKIHRHSPKDLIVSMSYTVLSGDKKARDPLTGLLYQGRDLYNEYFGKSKNKGTLRRLKTILRDGYLHGYNSAVSYLQETLKLPVEALTEDEIFEIDWSRLNSGPVPAIPHLLIVNRDGVTRTGDGNAHIASRLFMAGAPIENKVRVYLPGRKKYVGYAVLDAKPNREWDPEKPASRLNQLMFGSNPVNHARVHDTSITVQFTARNQREVIKNAQNLTAEGNKATRLAEGKGRIDLGAAHKRQTAMDSEWILREGGVSARVAYLVEIERDTAEALDVALDQFCSLPQWTGELLAVEREYAHKLFFQALPYAWEKLLYSPWDRRLEDTTHALTAFVPLIYDRMPDKSGVEYISRNGYTPIYQNPFLEKPHKHVFKMGTTGAGKSLEEIGSIIAALAVGGNVIIVDATRADGTGTFDPITSFLGGSYFNTGVDSYNLFEGGDFRKYEAGDVRKTVVETFRNFLLDALKDLCSGDDPDPKSTRICRQILGILIEQFLERTDIQSRYDAAFDGGFGSEAWQRIPTLIDFYGYMQAESLPEMLQTPKTLAALGDMVLSLSAVLARPIGRTISRPSTFRSKSRLTVVALGNLTNNEDAMPLALAASSFVLSSALENERTLFIGDESSYLATFDSYMQILAGFCTGGRKMGVWVHLLGQTLARILKSQFSADIIDNIDTWMVGVVQPAALPGLLSVGIPEHLLKAAVLEDGMEPPAQDVVSTWLIAQPTRGNYAQVFYPPSFAHLALGINSKTEVPLRNSYLQKYPNDKYKAIAELAGHLRSQSIHALEDM